MTREVIELEDHSTSYGGNGVLSHVCWPNGSVSSVPQACRDLLVAVTLARLEMR